MPVEKAARRRGAGAADSGARIPWNAEVNGAQRSACARAGEPRDDATGASSAEGLQQAVEGANAIVADGEFFRGGLCCCSARRLAVALLLCCRVRWLAGRGYQDEMRRSFVRTWHALLPFAVDSSTRQQTYVSAPWRARCTFSFFFKKN